MIAFLSGLVRHLGNHLIILDVHGVGYKVLLPSNLSLIENETASLFIHTHVREDTLALYGFADPASLNLFETLISVSGIGPKIGMTLISSASPRDISQAISTNNVNFFTAIPGIGKKGAQRLIVELKSKIGGDTLDMGDLDNASELVEALTGLGFKALEIRTVLNKVDSANPLQDQLKTALKFLKP